MPCFMNAMKSPHCSSPDELGSRARHTARSTELGTLDSGSMSSSRTSELNSEKEM